MVDLREATTVPTTRSARPPRRVALAVGTGLGSAMTFVVALGVAVWLHLDLPAARRFVVGAVNTALAASFSGKIILENVGELHLGAARGVDAHLVAQDGTTLVIARGVRGHVRPFALLKSLLGGTSPLEVGVLGIDVESLDVNLDADETGKLKIQSAVEPSPTTSPSPQTAAGGRSLQLDLPDVAVRHAFVHGRMKGLPAIDADLDALRGSLHVDSSRVSVDVTRVALTARAMPQGANPVGALDVRIAVPSKTGRPLGLEASFDGTVGGIPAKVRAALDGDRLDGVLDVPEVADEKVRALLPQAPIYRPSAAHVEAHGALHRVATTAHVTVGGTEGDAEGDLTLDGPFGATIGLDLRNVDLRELLPGAPRSNLSLHAGARIDTKEGGSTQGHFTAALSAGVVGGQPFPAATILGDFAQVTASSRSVGGGEGVSITLQGVVAEPGAPTDVTMELRTDGPVPLLRFRASSRIVWLAHLRRLGGLGPGRAEFHLGGVVTFASTPSLDATLVAEVDALERPPVYTQEARVTARATGPFADLSVTAAIEADGLRAANFKFRRGRVTAEGPLSAARVTVSLEGDGAPNVRARTTVSLGTVLRLQNADLDLSRGARALHATATEIRFDPHGLRVAGASITGVGEPASGSIDTRPGSLVVRGTSKGLDLEALGYLMGLESTLRKGRFAFAVDLAARPDGADGSATADLEHGSFAGFDELSGHVEAQMDGRKVTGAMKAALSGVAWLDVSHLDVDFGGKGALDAGWWRRAWGSVVLDAQVDLAKAAALLPPNTLPLSKLAGQLTLQAHVRRDDEEDVTPDVAIALKTFGLTLSPRAVPEQGTEGTTLVATPPWNLSGIDVQVDAQANGDSGFAEVAARLVDKEGVLVSLDAKSAAIPYDRLFASGSAFELLKDAPFSALLVVPSRRLDRLPDILQPDGGSGEAEARISIEGTCRRPLVEATAAARDARFAASPLARGIDAKLAAKYDGTSGDVVLDGKTSKNSEFHANAHLNAKADDLFSAPVALFPWDASATATFVRFPLGSIASLNDLQVRGQASGRIELTGWHKDARAVVDLTLNDLSVPNTAATAGSLNATLDGQAFDGRVRLEQNGAFAAASARVSTRWGTSLAPSIDPSGTAVASFQARKFPASFLAPFAGNVLDELEGLIDADARISLAPQRKPEMDGTMALRDGLVEVTALGQELHAVKGRVRLTPDGVVRLEDASASGTTGRLTASGVAHLDGLSFLDADAIVKIDHNEAIPLDLQGSPLGTVYGQFNLKAKASADQRALSLKVDMPSLHVALPEASTHSVQELDEAEPETHAGVYTAPGRFVVLPLDGFDAQQQEQAAGAAQPSGTLTVAVHLGQNVEIERGTDLRVDLEGDLTAKMAQTNEVTGRIVLKSGKLDVQGKPFEIQSGTVTFVGDPSNPEVNVTAGWTASDGTRVYADYIGPLKTGRVILRSEPTRPQNEILALVLFGTADGLAPSASSSQQTTSTAQSAGTTVGSFATGGLNKGLDKLTGMQITAKIDTTQAYTRPEVAVQIARDISLQIAVVLGAPDGVDTTLATIDWRFLKNWSLETTFGNKGTSIADIIWQHRY